jgi:hypothetical protein
VGALGPSGAVVASGPLASGRTVLPPVPALVLPPLPPLLVLAPPLPGFPPRALGSLPPLVPPVPALVLPPLLPPEEPPLALVAPPLPPRDAPPIEGALLGEQPPAASKATTIQDFGFVMPGKRYDNRATGKSARQSHATLAPAQPVLSRNVGQTFYLPRTLTFVAMSDGIDQEEAAVSRRRATHQHEPRITTPTTSEATPKRHEAASTRRPSPVLTRAIRRLLFAT